MIISLIRFIDVWILRGVLFLLPVSNINTPPSSPKCILFIRLWGMGSAVLSLPLLQKLRSLYPEARIDILVTPNTRGIFTRTSLVNGAVINLFSLQGLWQIFRAFRTYDLVIDTEEYFSVSSLVTFYCGKYRIGFDTMISRKNAYHRATAFNAMQHFSDTYLDLLRLNTDVHLPLVEKLIPIEFSHVARNTVEEYIQSLPTHTHIIGIHPGGSTTAPERFWSTAHWVFLCIGLMVKYPNTLILMTGTKLEKVAHTDILNALEHQERVVSTIGSIPTDLGTFAALLTHMDAYISNDSGPMHLAWAMRTPTIGLFGPNLPVRYEPLPRDKCIWLYKGNWVPTIDPHRGVFQRDTEWLVNRISPSEVCKQVQKIFSEKF